MRGVNKVILLGTVGRDPEVRSLGASGSTVTSISLATSEAWKDKNTGQLTEQTEWHKIVFYGRLAEISGEYLRKGSKVAAFHLGNVVDLRKKGHNGPRKARMRHGF